MHTDVLEGYRLSAQQLYYWRWLQSGNELRVQGVIRIEGALDSQLLKAALQRVVDRHEMLRTSFHAAGEMGGVLQSVKENCCCALTEIDLRSESLSELTAMDQACEEEWKRPFDYQQGPLLHALLVRLEVDEQRLVLTLPALCADARTIENLMRELASNYQAVLANLEPEQDEELVQYADYAQWREELREGVEGAEGRAFWQEQRVLDRVVRIGTEERVGESRDRDEALEVEVWLSTGDEREIEAAADAEGVSASTLMQAAWHALLWRHSNEEEIAVEVSFDGRKYEYLANAVGSFAQHLPVSCRFADQSAFNTILRRTKEANERAAEWQDYYREQHEAVSSSDSRIGFEYQSWSTPKRARDLRFELVKLSSTRGPFKLKLMVQQQQRGIRLALQYDAQFFTHRSVERLLEEYVTLLKSGVAQRQALVKDLQIVGHDEREEVLYRWNQTQREYRREVTLQELFEEQVARTPGAVAVRYEAAALSYEELNQRANQLARQLRSLGVGAEAVVGIYLERSLELVVAVFGVLKAGGAYLPLDPGYPGERLEYMLRDARAQVLVSEAQLAAGLNWSGPTVCLARDRASLSEQASGNLAAVSGSEHLAYVIYTSGSTGQPKGVGIAQAAIVNHMQWLQERFELGAGARVLQKTPFSFDASVWEFFGPLLSGGELVVARPGGHQEPEYLLATVKRYDVTILQVVPTLLRALVSAGGLRECGSLRLLFSGGEELAQELVAQVQEQLGVAIYNLYGPTEASIDTTCGEAVGEEARAQVRLGHPIGNLEVYVLDEQQELAPVGVAGELYIGGAGLARGYYGRAAETAEKFLPHRYSRQPGARLYRTGDRGRYLGDGQLEYLGRWDQQVKVRGYRIQLGEIEAVLRGHAGVVESVVVVAAGGRGEPQLVGYVVGQEGAAVSGEELRSYLREQLPEYLVPVTIAEVARWPLTPSGKVDRGALAAGYGERATAGREYVAPQTTTERQLAEIWAKVLKVKEVGVEDNFFALGGDSILSLQVVARARAVGLQLTPKQLFQYQTLGGLAQQAERLEQPVDQEGPAGSETEESGEQDIAAPLTPIQRQFMRQARPEPQHYNQALLLQVPAGSRVEELRQAVALVVQHHAGLRLRFREVAAGEWEQWVGEQETNQVFQHYDLSGLTEAEQRQELEATAGQLQRSLNLTAGPLLRVAYFSCGERAGRLLVIVHHLVVDGVSWRILLEDLAAVRAQLAAGQEASAVELPGRSSSYQQWARGLQQYAGAAELQAELGYWQEVVAAAQRAGRVERGADAENEGMQQVRLSREQTRALLQQVPELAHAQIQEVLVTALGRAWEGWSGRAQVVVEMEGHGREEVVAGMDLTRTVGWFTSLYPVVLRSRGGETGVAALKRVKEQLRRVPQQGIGYGVLKELSAGVELRAELTVRSEVSFNYLGQFDQVLGGGEGGWEHAGESVGPLMGEGPGGPEPLTVTALVAGGQLQVNWGAGAGVAELAQSFEAELLDLIAECTSGEAGGYTPSDFPQLQLNQAQLDQVTQGRGAIEDIYRLTAMQEGLLFHTLYAPQGGAYYVQLSYELEGALEVPWLKAAWQQVVARHEVLRSSFVWEGLAEPLQVVQRRVTLPVKEYDWRALPAAEQVERLRAHQEGERREGFALAEAPLLKLSLMRLGAQRYYLNWSHHHLLLDGWCTSIVLQEVFACYEGLRQGAAVRLPRRRPYRSYVEWLQGQELGAAERYWRARLRGFRGAPALPLSRPGAAESGAATGSYAESEVKLSAETTGRLKTVARRRHLTLNTLVEGAWALLLARYSGEKDVVFGITVSGRPVELADAEQMVGLFINTLPLRVVVEEAQAVWPWLAELQQQQAEMQSYEYSPLVQVQGWSEVERGAPLFETILVFENYPVDPLRRAPGGDETGVLKLLGIQSREQTNYPLTLRARPEQRLVLNFIFDEQLFEAQTIERMLGHLQLILETLAIDEEQSLSALPLMTTAEREEVLHGWNQTQQEYPRDVSLQLLFEQQVERTPNRIALVFDEQQLTYTELNIRANQLAHYLRSAGVGPEVPVGICMERSLEMVVALFGTLKAGGVYLPLDPSYPQERLSFMLDDAQVKVVLTQERFAGMLEANAVELLCLDSEATAIERQSSENPDGTAIEDNLAYVIYTSGSTGKPKGSMISHRGICNRLLWMQQTYQLGESDRVLQKTPFSFDVSVWEFFWPLLTGARLVVARPGGHQDSSYLLKLIETRQITVLHFVPSMLQVFLNEPDLEPARCVKKVICSGETLSFDLQESFFARMDAELHNLYGPTEASVDVTHWACDREARHRIVPIGGPIANTEIYILDKTGQPVPAGVRGELHIAGVGLARGYLQRADLTAEKFIPNRFSRQPGERLYRTGDLARYLEDGSIEFVGRVDYQLKMRGFRIEPGEIEAVLMRHPSVRESVVVALESETGDKQLIAYVVSETNDVADLRQHLKNKVPEYMASVSFVLLDQMPLTANGKLDRKALPAPEQTRITQPDYVAPRNVVEEVLAGIWCEVLNVGQVGVDDDFFELGGHSLLVTQVISRAREALGVNIEIRQLFESPTIAELAADIESNLKGEPGRMPLLERVSRDQTLPLSFGQQRLWFINKLEPESPFYNMSYGVRLTGELDHAALELTLSEIIRRHETLRTCFVEMDGEPQQFILPAANVSIDEQDLTALSEAEWQAEVQRIASQTARQPFDLSAGPLRMKLLRGGDNEHVLLITIHHIASDGWSLSIMFREVGALYNAYRQGQPSPLPELTIQYSDFAVWQRKWLQGDALNSQLNYWKHQLADVPSVLELPTDRLRPAVQSFHGAYERFNLPPKLSEDLRRLSRGEGVTLFMSLLAAWQILLSRYAGQEDVVVGSPIANRDRTETEGLIGFFVNTLVLRTDLSGDPTFCEVLNRVRQVTLGAYTHQDLPFEKLVEELQPERSLSHSPLFQVMFTFDNAPAEVLQLSGLSLSGVSSETAPVRFDLLLTMRGVTNAIAGELGYNLDLFDKATIRRMIAHFKQLLEVVVANNEQPLSTLSFVTEAEEQLISDWNITEEAFPQAARLSELFERQVTQSPDALAAIFENEQLTYTELNERANRLAHHLQSLGVGPQILVGLYLESPLETVIGILAVLKTGGAYVPLDSQSPPERLAFMIADARMPFVLTQQTIKHLLPESRAQIICLDSIRETLATYSAENPSCSATSLSVAYLIYTSGSTGDPKAVLVEHRNVVNIIQASARKFGFTATDVMPVLASFAFDISLFELMAPLTTGGTVVLCSRAQVMDLPRLAQIVEQCTMLHMVPSLMRQFLNLIEKLDIGPRYKRLRQIFIGGDAVPPDVLSKLAGTFPQARIEVLYGPTETTLFCTSLEATTAETSSRLVIGRPLANVKIRICDQHQAQLPIGMAGEICIGGAGVARGYLSQDRLTKEKFPIIEGRRYYRSGDRGRYLPDGNIEFLGRVDDQVKIRGYRVEPGEIAAALKSHPSVQDAVVVANSDQDSEKRLLAYVVPATSSNGAASKEDRLELWPSIGEYPVYDDLIYYGLTNDDARNRLYYAAIREFVKDKIVVDVGTGGDAILARLCIEAGARHVYAIEILEASYEAAKRQLDELGLSEKITLIHGDATQVELPQPCDVCVTETFEAIGGAEGAARILNGTRRLLKSEGVFIPHRSLTRIAAVRLPDEIRREPRFTEVSGAYVEKIFAAVGHPFDLRLCIKNFPASNVISEIGILEDLDFSGFAAEEYSRELSLTINEDGRLDGLLVWLRLELGAGVVLDTLEEKYSWFPAYFPIFHPGVAVRAGDRLEAVCAGSLSSDGVHPDYTMKGRLIRQGQDAQEFRFDSLHHGQQYKANAFYEELFSDDSAPERQPQREMEVAQLREYLQQRLPGYMVPAAFLLLDEIPLTLNGKLDKRRLPLPEQTGVAGEREYVEPKTEIEKGVAKIFAQVLDLERVDCSESFFDIGGHSLMATQVISRISEMFDVDLPLRSIFESPTVVALSRVIEAAAQAAESQALSRAPEIVRLNRDAYRID